MEYLSDIMLLSIVGVNIAIILSCLVNIGMQGHTKKKKTGVTVCMLIANAVLDVMFMAYFFKSNVTDNAKVFILFLPMTGWTLYEAIQEQRRVR